MAPVTFWSAPGTYIHWAARHKPAIFWSIVVGSMGPVVVVCAQRIWSRVNECEIANGDDICQVVAPPIRKYFGDGPRPQIPLTYPVPRGQRRIPSGYDD
ncbi:hypothetical protein B0A55_06604 [Friedmanniomyces simplex]|uniref:Uncharacterized protein n=1 Tax=Friedmanniomyces simplex TaxID=329884 RepID=A0A4U0X1W6_9PEZI|nr:hypothetical protein B0A55_06604 [Friedmanniomyces simplex]